MPFWMNFEALAVAAPTRAATRAAAATQMATQRNGCVPTERAGRATQSFFVLDLGLPPEKLPRPRDVRLADLRIIDRKCFEHDRAGRSGHADDRFGELEQGHLGRVADVDREMLSRLDQQDEPAHEIVDVTEAPRLGAA